MSVLPHGFGGLISGVNGSVAGIVGGDHDVAILFGGFLHKGDGKGTTRTGFEDENDRGGFNLGS